jgi:hypothetical protein
VAATPGLHPAQNRGLRELYASTRQVAEHWGSLAGLLAPSPEATLLEEGAAGARTLIGELTPVTERHGLYARIAAQAVGSRVADARNIVGDRTLERNQALRMAVLDVQHLVTLLAYQERLARGGDEALAGVLATGHERFADLEGRARELAIAQADDPDAAIERADASAVGAAGYKVAVGFGTIGEWFDRQVGRRGPQPPVA